MRDCSSHSTCSEKWIFILSSFVAAIPTVSICQRWVLEEFLKAHPRTGWKKSCTDGKGWDQYPANRVSFDLPKSGRGRNLCRPFSSPEPLGLICNRPVAAHRFPTTWRTNDGLWGRECSAHILDNSYWACSKFKFFRDANQTVTVASTAFVSKCKC